MDNPIKNPPVSGKGSGGSGPLPAAETPEEKPEAPKGDTAKNAEMEGQSQVEEAQTTQAPRIRAPQNREQPPADKTQFKLPEPFERGAEIPQRLGHKIDINQQVVRPGDRPQLPLDRPRTTGENARFNPRMPHHPPTSHDYRQAAGMRFFRTLGQGGPLQQKLLQNAEVEQMARNVNTGQRLAEPLTKGEILQLMPMRHGAENKERFRNLLRHEIAKTRAEQNQKVQTIHYQAESQGEEANQTQRATVHSPRLDSAKQRLTERLKNATSLFEQALQKVFSGKAKSVPELIEGAKARFLAKSSSEWNAFLHNVSQQGSVEQADKIRLSQLVEALFRGVFTKDADGKLMLVADFSLEEDGQVTENKFSQVEIKDEGLSTLLKNLTPGDPLKTEVLQQLGHEFDFIKLVHLLAIVELTEEQRNNLLKSLRQGSSSEALRKIEQQLAQKREDDEYQRKQKQANFVYAGMNPPAKQRFPGRPRFFMLLFYSLLGTATGLILYIVLRALL